MKIQVFPLDFEGVKRIGIRPLGFDRSFPSLMKKIPGSRWTPKEKCWHIPYRKNSYDQLKRLFGEGQIVALRRRFVRPEPKTKAENEKLPARLKYGEELIRVEERLKIQRYSYNTIKTYKSFFAQYLTFYPEQHPETLQKEDIIKFLLQSTREKKWSDSTQNQAVNAIKFYYEKVLGQKRTYYELRPRKSRKLPGVFSEKEVIRLFEAVKNLKHRTILMLIYSAGLRIGESTRLRKEDVKTDRRTVFVKAGKGKKDRYSVLSEQFIEIMNRYLEIYQPEYWLFEGPDGGPYSASSICK